MNIEQIMMEIRRCEASINELEQSNVRLREDQDALQLLMMKVGSLQNRLQEDCTRRATKLSDFGSLGSNRCAMEYQQGMRDLLMGKEYTNAVGGLSDGVSRIKYKIMEMDSSIDENMHQVKYFQRKIEQLCAELNAQLKMQGEG